MRISRWQLGASLGGLLACASYPKPVEHLASSEAALRSAKEVGAASVPQAALELKLASEELDQSQKLMASDDNERADRLLLRARADAELALALARQTEAELQEKAVDDRAAALNPTVQ